MLKKILSIYLVLYLIVPMIVPCFTTYAQAEEPKSLAVLDLEAKGVPLLQSQVVSERIRSYVTQLTISGKYRTNGNIQQYTIIERTQMDKIFEQYDIQNMGCVADSCMIEYGKMLQASRIIVGSIGYIGETYSISVRIIDVESSETIATANRQHRGAIDDIVETVSVELVDELLLGKKKKSKKMWYLIAGVVAAAGVGVAMVGGGDDGGGGSDTRSSLPMPPNMP